MGIIASASRNTMENYLFLAVPHNFPDLLARNGSRHQVLVKSACVCVGSSGQYRSILQDQASRTSQQSIKAIGSAGKLRSQERQPYPSSKAAPLHRGSVPPNKAVPGPLVCPPAAMLLSQFSCSHAMNWATKVFQLKPSPSWHLVGSTVTQPSCPSFFTHGRRITQASRVTRSLGSRSKTIPGSTAGLPL